MASPPSAIFQGYGHYDSCLEYRRYPFYQYLNASRHLVVQPRDTRWWHHSLVSRSYAKHDLCNNFINSFAYDSTKVRGLKPSQSRALPRFRSWQPAIQLPLREQGLDLQYPFEIFDDSFFGGALKAFTILKRVQWYPGIKFFDQTSFNRFKLSNTDPPIIEIATPEPGKDWTRASIQGILATLLHEMAHAAFGIFACQCWNCRSAVQGEDAAGFRGHGPAWIKLYQAIEARANRSFRGLSCKKWRLDTRIPSLNMRNEYAAARAFENRRKTAQVFHRPRVSVMLRER